MFTLEIDLSFKNKIVEVQGRLHNIWLTQYRGINVTTGTQSKRKGGFVTFLINFTRIDTLGKISR